MDSAGLLPSCKTLWLNIHIHAFVCYTINLSITGKLSHINPVESVAEYPVLANHEMHPPHLTNLRLVQTVQPSEFCYKGSICRWYRIWSNIVFRTHRTLEPQ